MEHDVYAKMFEFEKGFWWFVGRRKIVFNELAKITSTLANVVLVDIGCGTGITMELATGFQKKIGIDFSEEALRYAKTRNCGELVAGDIYKIPIADNTADCVLLMDVLEHLRDESDPLKEVFRICKKGGRIIVTVPAYQFLWGGEDEVSMHKRRYTKTRLLSIIEEAGFQVERTSYFNTILFPIIGAIILFNRLFNTRAKHETNMKRLPKILNTGLIKMLLLEAWLLKKITFPYGASVICVAKKN
ncbi:hypothetical protein A2482_00725 [Candidatus Falkowbacteria bacterium RIFOXYC2_FULL_48_21]|uniref:Methyltransferase type 11 domain-containing protein n=1 Tax=Candidatus Falkowbacteria bacterium RIFOXYC2_FULL_48_21 TaxID=1798005 RepID=A0A1F5T751_9BACT|nr:MAG: hypothetical protein A2482_00725 [Candidatus Falkowbacteria bacterium RIFOXYC2_FULL_48_21]